MRLTTLATYAFAAVALLATPICAQSGLRSAAPSVAPAINAPAISAPAINVPSVATEALGSATRQAIGSQVTGSPVFGTAPAAITGNSVLSSPAIPPAMSYSGPISYGNAVQSPQSAAYGPVSVGPYPQGPACCNLSPTQPGYQRQPVTSCCGNIGRLGVPPLFTPLRFDMPPVGAAVGRPLFGRWNGF